MIFYQAGYKYQLAKTYVLSTEIKPPNPIRTKYIELTLRGKLTIRGGYAWDGPSGIAIDTPNFMRGSLVHDALYQLLREELLSACMREPVDKLLQNICLEDGMSAIRAWWVYHGVRLGGGPAASPANRKIILQAPLED